MRLFLKNNLKSLIIFASLTLGIVFAVLIANFSRAFAENDEEDFSKIISEENHVVIFDGDDKFSIKTDARTVKEALERAKVEITEFDAVDPSSDTEINADNFFINIYRAHPALVIDGAARKYLMTASFDAKQIAIEAGFSIFDGDEVKPTNNSQFLELGNIIAYEVKHSDGSTITIEEEIPFEEKEEKDFELGSGKTEVVQLGEVGKKETVYKVKTKNGVEVSREKVSEKVLKEPVTRITHVGVDPVEMHPLTASMGRNRYTISNGKGLIVERQETYYDLDMSKVMQNAMSTGGVWADCSHTGHYSVREDGAKVDDDGYVLVAAELSRYPRCSVVQTSLGPGKVYDTGTFAQTNPEQFDLATDWTKRDGI